MGEGPWVRFLPILCPYPTSTRRHPGLRRGGLYPVWALLREAAGAGEGEDGGCGAGQWLCEEGEQDLSPQRTGSTLLPLSKRLPSR